mmetsp:Transcript_92533/g.266114  ORF Transcript_92533/g.266114 Transcript_92533/m.266114 type:complete len:279 (-) Transcript_92533:629-1465(-)
MPPPFCAVGQWEYWRQSSPNFLLSNNTKSFAVRGALAAPFKASFNSFKNCRSNTSASCRGRTGFAFALEALDAALLFLTGAVASCVRSRMCRSLMLRIPSLLPAFGFFAAGGASAFFSFLSCAFSFGGRKQTWASSSCDGTGCDFTFSTAAATMSPQAIRGCMWKSAAASTSSTPLITRINVEEANSKNGWLSQPLSATECTSGVQAVVLPWAFLAGSPKEPTEVVAWLPSAMGATRSPSASASHAPHWPSLAMKTWLPKSSAAAAPQPSSTCGLVAK